MARPRTEHCIAGHGDDRRRDGGGRCGECRRERTRAQRRARAAAMAAHKAERGCLRCGSRDDLQFHHRDPATKVDSVSNLVRWGWAPLWAEVAKCDVLCATCHAEHHFPAVADAADASV